MRLILSARDTASAFCMLPLLKAARQSGFRIQLCATGPALQVLQEYQPTAAPDKNLTLFCNEQVRGFQPDAVITGLSGPDAGLDEYLQAAARSAGVASYAVQDFWGDINPSAPPADCYLVCDEFAARLSTARGAPRTYISGMLRYQEAPAARWSDLWTAGNSLALSTGKPVIGWFGMPLGHLQGYWDTLKTLSHALPDSTCLLYRPHPAESAVQRHKTLQILAGHSPVVVSSSLSIEATLSQCRLAVSLFSSIGTDNTLLSARYRSHCSASLYLLNHPQIRKLFEDYTGLTEMPWTKAGISYTNRRPEELAQQIRHILNVPPPGPEQLRQHLGELHTASRRVLSFIQSDLTGMETSPHA